MIPKNKLSFVRMRDFIKSNYNTKEYKWEPLVVENKCIPKPERNINPLLMFNLILHKIYYYLLLP